MILKNVKMNNFQTLHRSKTQVKLMNPDQKLAQSEVTRARSKFRNFGLEQTLFYNNQLQERNGYISSMLRTAVQFGTFLQFFVSSQCAMFSTKTCFEVNSDGKCWKLTLSGWLQQLVRKLLSTLRPELPFSS